MRRLRLALLVACAAAIAAPARADEPGAAPDRRPGARDLTRPELQWVAAEARIGLGWLHGGALRDSRAVAGTQVNFGRDLDLRSPEAVGTITLHVRPYRAWRLTAELTWSSFDGRAAQTGGSIFSPTPPSLSFDGTTYTSQVLRSDLDLLVGTVGLWRRWSQLDHASFDVGLGVHWLAADLEIGVPGGPTAKERSQAATPWFGGSLVMPVAPWLDWRVGGRAGFLWGGDSVRFQVHAILDLWVALAVPVGPFQAALRLDYRLCSTRERSHGQDEQFDYSLVVPSLSIGFMF